MECISMKKKINPNSLKNLTHEGRPTVYKQKKTTHNISVTPAGWEGVKAKAHSLGYSGVSELVEQVGRGQVHIEKKLLDNSQSCSITNMNNESIKSQEIIDEYLKKNIDKHLKKFIDKHLKNFMDEHLKNFIDERFKIFLNEI